MTSSHSRDVDTDIIEGVLTGNGTRLTVGVATRKDNGNKFVSILIRAADGRSLSARIGHTPARFILNAMVEAVEAVEATPKREPTPRSTPRSTSSPSSPELIAGNDQHIASAAAPSARTENGYAAPAREESTHA